MGSRLGLVGYSGIVLVRGAKARPWASGWGISCPPPLLSRRQLCPPTPALAAGAGGDSCCVWVAPGAELAPRSLAPQGRGSSSPGTARARGPSRGMSTGGWAVPFPPAARIASSSSSVVFKGVWVMRGQLGAELWVQGRAGRVTNRFYILLKPFLTQLSGFPILGSPPLPLCSYQSEFPVPPSLGTESFLWGHGGAGWQIGD